MIPIPHYGIPKLTFTGEEAARLIKILELIHEYIVKPAAAAVDALLTARAGRGSRVTIKNALPHTASKQKKYYFCALKTQLVDHLMNNDNSERHTTAVTGRLSHRLAYYATLAVVKLVSWIPFGLLYLLSDLLYWPLYHLVRYRRRIVRKNLTESFPDKGPDEIRRIERRFYRFIIDLVLESCKLMTITPGQMRQRMRFVNIDALNTPLQQGHSVSVFLGHHGNWEWASSSGLWLTPQGRAAQVYHQLNNPYLDNIMRQMRSRMGNECVVMDRTVHYIVEGQGQDKPLAIGLIADQSPRRHASKHFLNFLHHMAPVLTGPEKVTKHFGFQAVYFSIRRVKRGYYECHVSQLHDDPKSLADYELTRLYYQRLEQDILEQPECYLWTHNRFKYAR